MIVSEPFEFSLAPDALKIRGKTSRAGARYGQIAAELVADDLKSPLLRIGRELPAVFFNHVAVFLDELVCGDLRDLFPESQFRP